MLEVIVIMLQLECSGHTNATCWFVRKEYPSIEECERARTKTVKKFTGFMMKRAEVEVQDEYSTCLKTIK